MGSEERMGQMEETRERMGSEGDLEQNPHGTLGYNWKLADRA